MPKGFRPHYDNFLGYTMPLVIRVLEKEYPDRFSDIPEEYVGPLKVTLAQDLAISARHVLFAGSRKNFLDKLRVRLLTKYGGREYTDQAAALQDALHWRSSTQTALALIDREAYPYYDRNVRDWPLERVSLGPAGTPVRWMYSEPERARVESLRARIDALLEAVPRSREAVDQQEKAMRHLEQKIEALPGYAEEFSSFKWRLGADFSAAMKWQEQGAPHYLRNLEHKWWYRFTEAFEAEVAADSQKPFRVALRDHSIIERIRPYVRRSKNWDHAASKFFEEHRGDWWDKAPTPRSVESCRLELVGDDLFVLRWTKENGRHRTFYAPWADSVINTAPDKQYFAPRGLSEVWVKELKGLLPDPPLRDDDSLRLNELQWVLSRGGAGPYKFRLYGSDQEKWRNHGIRWWTAIADAGGGTKYPANTKLFFEK